jgi:hypothetical protein
VHGASMILRDVNFENIRSPNDLPWELNGNGAGRSSNWDSPVFKDHTELQLMEFLGAGYMDWDGHSLLTSLSKKAIKKICIGKLIVSYSDHNRISYTRHLGNDHMSHLRARCLKVGVDNTSVIIEHFSSMAKLAPAFMISFYIKLLCGALNLDGGRRRKFAPDGSVHPNKCLDNPFPCYLCGLGSSQHPGDHPSHIFNKCEIVKKAWLTTLHHPLGPTDVSWHSVFSNMATPLYIPAYPLAPSPSAYNRLALVTSFCWATYKTIGQIRMGRTAECADARVVSMTLDLKNIWAHPSSSSKNNLKRKR